MLSRGDEPGMESSREQLYLVCEQYSREKQLPQTIL
jgi:hypothetical protein